MREVKRVLVTGATGMLGAHTVRRLLKENIEVVCLVRPDSKKKNALPVGEKGLKVMEASLFELPDCEALPRVDAVIHFGWAATFGAERNDEALQERNTEAGLNLLRLSKKLGAKVFIGAGSQAEYGPQEGILGEDTPCRPLTAYGKAKGKLRKEGMALAKELGIDFIWTRILSAYGPYDNSYTLVMSALNAFIKGEHFSCTPGDQIWDYLYAEDAAEIFYRLLLSGKNQRTYVLGGGQKKTLREYITLIRDAVNPGLSIGFGERAYNPDQVMHLEADLTALREDTGYTPGTSFEEGIQKTAAWLREEESK